MADQIQKLVDDNQMLSRAVSHNMKTPITRLRMGIDVLEESVGDSKHDKYFSRINSDLDEMQALVDTLLQYSRFDNFKLRLKNEPIDFREFIPSLIEAHKTTGVMVTTFFPDSSIILNSDHRYVSMALANILSNATQHAKSLVQIRVCLINSEAKNSAVSVTIEDNAGGISEADRIHATKPFWRGASDPSINGHGMGLAIVERITDWLRADLFIERSTSLGGASVRIVFSDQ